MTLEHCTALRVPVALLRNHNQYIDKTKRNETNTHVNTSDKKITKTTNNNIRKLGKRTTHKYMQYKEFVD